MPDSPDSIAARIRVARRRQPADVVLKNGQIINVFTAEIGEGDIAICQGRIAALGRDYEGRRQVDLEGRYVAPGFIDGHLHLESSLLAPDQFARAVLPRGTTTVICDPHEIANVLGAEGVRYLLRASRELPLSFFFMAPSCVPATGLETAGAVLDVKALATLFDEERVLGLAEMMNFPGVLAGDRQVLEKLSLARHRRRLMDGHAPGLTGAELMAYAAAGPDSDHECTSPQEALEKLRAGMYLFVREGSTARNLAALARVVTEANSRRCLLVSDDRHPADLLARGHLDHSLRLAVQAGILPLTAIRMVTLNAAARFGLHDRGAVAPGRRADLVVFEGLGDFTIHSVYAAGELVAEAGRAHVVAAPPTVPPAAMRVAWQQVDFAVPAQTATIRVIGLIPDQLVTEARLMPATVADGLAVADPERDLMKLAVIERHRQSGNVGLGFVQGLGPLDGALASTVAHDSHNLIVVGSNDQDMALAARAVAEMGGGLAVAAGGRVAARLALPLAGLMSPEPLEVVAAAHGELLAAARQQGCRLDDPFMALSFLSLPVIPALKLTDRGLVDVERFEIVTLFV